MERVNRILKHRTYLESLRLIEEKEADRIFCRHNMRHFMDVARIAMILNLEENKAVAKEYIYAAALLHDCGRHIQYENGTPHEIASGEIAEGILADCEFDPGESEMILRAIRMHRNKEEAYKEPLSELIYRADKLSRECFYCASYELCDRKPEKKTDFLRY